MQNESQKPIKSKAAFAASLLKPYKKLLLGGFLSLLVVDIADVLPPIIIKMAIDGIERGADTAYLLYCGAGLMVISLIQGLFRFFWRKCFLGASHMSVYDLRKQLFSHLLKLPFHYFSRTRTGDIMSRLTNDVQEIRFMLGIGILIGLDTSFYLLSIPFLMLWLSPELTFATLVPLVLIPVLVLSVSKAIHNRSREVQARLSDLSSRSEESISGIRIIKGFCTEESEMEKFDQVGQDFVRDKIRLANIDSFFHPGLTLLVAAGMVILLLYGGQLVIAGSISLGVFIAFQSYMLKLSWPMMAIGWIINLYQRSMASMERCLQILNEPISGADQQYGNLQPSSYDLEARNLSFTYPDGKGPVLKNVSFRLAAGKTLGITGPVGCGKSTLLRIITRMFEPDSGQIFIGGISSKDISLAHYKSLFAVVPQETFLFSESIRENILFAKTDKSDSELALQNALSAGLEPDMNEFPHGVDTMLGEKGVNLSGGQKQRISLARALASDRPFLLLDDCTSAVDTETETEILLGIKTSKNARTCIVVSHRMVSLQNSDLILYIENGQIAESGNHNELLKQKGQYAKTWEKQRLKEELEKTNG